jgi:hypothetical protein
MAIQGKPRLGERLRGYFSELPEKAPPAEDSDPARAETRAVIPTRVSGREQLYADIGGTVIGLGGAVALLSFVLLK